MLYRREIRQENPFQTVAETDLDPAVSEMGFCDS